MHQYIARVLGAVVRQLYKQIFCAVNRVSCDMNMYFKHVRIPEQIALHVHDRAWFLEQCMSSRPLCYYPLASSI